MFILEFAVNPLCAAEISIIGTSAIELPMMEIYIIQLIGYFLFSERFALLWIQCNPGWLHVKAED